MRRNLAIFLLAAIVAPVAAQPPAAPPTRLKIRPAGPPDPVLKFTLLPEVIDQSPGNAALFYQRSHSPEWMGYRREKDYYKKIEEWLNAPLKDLPRDQLGYYANSAMLREVDLAARREQCDWEFTERFKKEHFAMLLPDIQWFREVGNLLALRARLEMAEGKYDSAGHTFQTAFGLARHLNETPILIPSLVGLAVGHITLARVEEFIQQPGAPNLYWALANAPRPFFDLRRALQGEKAVMEELFQGLVGERPGRASLAGQLGMRGYTRRTVGAGPRPLSADELQLMVDDLTAVAVLAREGPASGVDRLTTMATAVKNYPQARDALVARGYAAVTVDALPVLQVVALDSLHHNRRLRDEMYKWFGLPYWQARPGVDEALRQLGEARARLECFPALLDVLPAVGKVFSASARFDRRLAALRCVEAVRLHAAAHGGKLPLTLAAITAVPVPVDPMTGKEFVYEAAGNLATLYAPTPPGETPAPHNTVRYEITLER